MPRAAAIAAEFRAQARKSLAFAAAGGNSTFFTLIDERRELQQASQRPSLRRRPLTFESAMPTGTKTITDKNLLSCKGAAGATDHVWEMDELRAAI
ncbi:MAG: hypothetical protein ABSB42_12695 [Tepidisphaeraceae bacterium]